MTGPQAQLLPDGRRLHLHHGPIDLIIEVWGPERDRAFSRAQVRFATLLDTLAAELPDLRSPDAQTFSDPVATRMLQAIARHRARGVFVTPMAAVAGSVADEILAAMGLSPRTPKAYVNNGGDIAFHLAPDQSLTLVSPAGPMRIRYDDQVRGVATSGWGGRSHSLGIADAVTVAAPTASAADVAATLIANVIDLPGHPAISRAPACDLAPDSDLGSRLVTTHVGALTHAEIEKALEPGHQQAQDFLARGWITQAALCVKGAVHSVSRADQGALSHA
jgi:ApbE superfamily uncharacterized protein (UPF0280 family)